MKKMKFLLSLTLLAALFLAACGGGGAVEGTPGIDMTGVPTLDSGLDATPDAGTGVDLTPTVGLDLETPTESVGAGTDLTSTPEMATLEPTGTPQAGTGMGDGQFVLLSDLFQFQANAADGAQLGTITGVVVNRPIPATGSGTGTGDLAGTETPDVDLTPTAESDTGAGSGTGTETMAVAGPVITYLVLDTSGAGASTGSEPSGALDTTETPEVGLTPTTDAGTGDTGMGSGTGTGTGSEVLIPWAAVSTQASSTGDTTSGNTTGMQALTLDITSADLAAAPAFDSAMNTSVSRPGWDTAIAQYWGGTGLSIPATGAGSTETGSATVMRSPLQSMSVTDSSGKSFGQVADYVIDLQTGELMYAVLSGSASAQGSYYLVPTGHFTWGGGASGAGMSSFSANFKGASLTGAPSFTALDDIDFSSIGEVDTYWESQSTGVQ